MEDEKVLITAFRDVLDKTGKDAKFTAFIRGIKEGHWQDIVLEIRAKLSKTTEKRERSKIKAKCPLFRVSGSFSGQSDSDLRKHSGFIAIDIDDVENVNTAKEIIKSDQYVYAAFTSISGNGLCLIVRIDGSRHLDAFEGVAKYLYDNYQLIVDQSGKNVGRARFVSFDPYMHINEDAHVFKKYLPKPKQQKQPPKIVFVETDFDAIIKSIYDRGLNLCEDYREWLRICYALVSHHGDTETGRDHFDLLSRHSSKYNQTDCRKQYDVCLRNHNDGKRKQSTVNYIYWLAKQNGIETYSLETKEVIRAAASQSKAGVSPKDISAGLKKFNEMPEEFSDPIIKQVIEQGIEHQTENIIDDIIHFLQPYGLRKNLVTRNIEMNGKPINDDDINTLFIDCKSLFDKATKDLVCSVIFSNKTVQYHPIKEFLDSSDAPINGTPELDKLARSMNSDTQDYGKWLTKWLVSLIAAVNDQYSPLVLVLCGEIQGTGKTEFMRRLLPKQLRNLFGESKMDNGKDDEILMTKKWIIFDDEYGGKSKREEKKLKEITSKEFINVREPYGRVSVDLRRLSVFCGSSNDNQILSDPTGNRRILPIHVISIDHDLYNSVDKSQLFHELNHLYKSGYDWRVLKEEIEQLKESTEEFNLSTPEEELLAVKMSPTDNEMLGEWMTVTEIIKYLTIDTKYVFSNVRVGMLLQKMGYNKKNMRKGGSPVRCYLVMKNENNSKVSEDNPF